MSEESFGGSFEGLPEQLLKDIEELKEELVKVYEAAISDYRYYGSNYIADGTKDWIDIRMMYMECSALPMALDGLVKLGEWEKHPKCPYTYRKIKKKKEKYYWKVVAKMVID